jgi:hypothetical protein
LWQTAEKSAKKLQRSSQGPEPRGRRFEPHGGRFADLGTKIFQLPEIAHTGFEGHDGELGVRLQATPFIQTRLEAICDIVLPDVRRHRLSLYLTCAAHSSFHKHRSPSVESKQF